jgi:hypothetical protein
VQETTAVVVRLSGEVTQLCADLGDRFGLSGDLHRVQGKGVFPFVVDNRDVFKRKEFRGRRGGYAKTLTVIWDMKNNIFGDLTPMD